MGYAEPDSGYKTTDFERRPWMFWYAELAPRIAFYNCVGVAVYYLYAFFEYPAQPKGWLTLRVILQFPVLNAVAWSTTPFPSPRVLVAAWIANGLAWALIAVGSLHVLRLVNRLQNQNP